jgi:hypothetical protein
MHEQLKIQGSTLEVTQPAIDFVVELVIETVVELANELVHPTQEFLEPEIDVAPEQKIEIIKQ